MSDQTERTVKQTPLTRKTVGNVADLAVALDRQVIPAEVIALASAGLGLARNAGSTDLISAIVLPHDSPTAIAAAIRLAGFDPLDLAIEALALGRDGLRSVAAVLAALPDVDENIARLPAADVKAARRIAGVIATLDAEQLELLNAGEALASGHIDRWRVETASDIPSHPEQQPFQPATPEASAPEPDYGSVGDFGFGE
ncbi:hypothetical protein [Pseudoclavibacter soli]|uniref:hypothetical protein n=1 Tax=Pseudoclavibacter soli TaxID=452623 RepID=UPI000418B480|nr:hypothetical protein [Pseudoclavibacter soli]